MDTTRVDDILYIVGMEEDEAVERVKGALEGMSTGQILKVITDSQLVGRRIVEHSDSVGYNSVMKEYVRDQWCIFVHLSKLELL